MQLVGNANNLLMQSIMPVGSYSINQTLLPSYLASNTRLSQIKFYKSRVPIIEATNSDIIYRDRANQSSGSFGAEYGFTKLSYSYIGREDVKLRTDTHKSTCAVNLLVEHTNIQGVVINQVNNGKLWFAPNLGLVKAQGIGLGVDYASLNVVDANQVTELQDIFNASIKNALKNNAK
ncbi:hypothetical protein ACTFIZ_012345 [Dictyostelium cf. discoideum]